MDQVYVKTKNQRLFFEIPKTWTLLTFAEFSDVPPGEDLETAVLNALKRPISSPPLTDCVSVEDSVAIIVEDLTRASPKKEILRTLSEQLKAVSIPDEQIVIVMALGTHRALSMDELSGAFGEDLTKRYTFINHDCHSSDLVPIGTLRTGTQVKINAQVHEADFRIGIGSIFPHPLNGFGGGGKILFPGVADFDSILEHHLKYALREGIEENQSGIENIGKRLIKGIIRYVAGGLTQRSAYREIISPSAPRSSLEIFMKQKPMPI